jgi:hypothetical protein
MTDIVGQSEKNEDVNGGMGWRVLLRDFYGDNPQVEADALMALDTEEVFPDSLRQFGDMDIHVIEGLVELVMKEKHPEYHYAVSLLRKLQVLLLEGMSEVWKELSDMQKSTIFNAKIMYAGAEGADYMIFSYLDGRVSTGAISSPFPFPDLIQKLASESGNSQLNEEFVKKIQDFYFEYKELCAKFVKERGLTPENII